MAGRSSTGVNRRPDRARPVWTVITVLPGWIRGLAGFIPDLVPKLDGAT